MQKVITSLVMVMLQVTLCSSLHGQEDRLIIHFLKAKQRNADGSIYNWNHNYHNNPYMTLNEDLNKLRRDRLIGNAMVKYQFYQLSECICQNRW